MDAGKGKLTIIRQEEEEGKGQLDPRAKTCCSTCNMYSVMYTFMHMYAIK